MLRNSRNESKGKYLCYECCSYYNNKNAQRAVKHGLKRKESISWEDEWNRLEDWTSAGRGEVWELKHCGEIGLWVCLDPTWNGAYWKSLDGNWLLIEPEDLSGISQGKLTGIVLDLE